MKRRDFVKASALAGLATQPASGSPASGASEQRRTVRVGIVGVGERGSSLTKVLLNLDGVEVKAICDINGG